MPVVFVEIKKYRYGLNKKPAVIFLENQKQLVNSGRTFFSENFYSHFNIKVKNLNRFNCATQHKYL